MSNFLSIPTLFCSSILCLRSVTFGSLEFLFAKRLAQQFSNLHFFLIQSVSSLFALVLYYPVDVSIVRLLASSADGSVLSIFKSSPTSSIFPITFQGITSSFLGILTCKLIKRIVFVFFFKKNFRSLCNSRIIELLFQKNKSIL